MTVEVQGIARLRRKLVRTRALLKVGQKDIMDKAGDYIIKEVIKRTNRGKDANGSSFKSYSSAYKNEKKGSWLYESGSMLSAMTKTATGNFLRVYIKKTRHAESPEISNFTLATVHNNGGRSGRGKGFKMKKRELMGLTKDELKNLVKFIKVNLLKKIRKL